MWDSDLPPAWRPECRISGRPGGDRDSHGENPSSGSESEAPGPTPRPRRRPSPGQFGLSESLSPFVLLSSTAKFGTMPSKQKKKTPRKKTKNAAAYKCARPRISLCNPEKNRPFKFLPSRACRRGRPARVRAGIRSRRPRGACEPMRCVSRAALRGWRAPLRRHFRDRVVRARKARPDSGRGPKRRDFARSLGRRHLISCRSLCAREIPPTAPTNRERPRRAC